MRLHNTLTRSVDEFTPRDPGRVGIYVCGPTVQGPPHFGHARASVVPDVLRRYLQWRGYEVFHVRNVTDIDDKIIDAAAQEGTTAAELAERYTRVWDHEIDRLGVLPPHVKPRATGHITEMITLISALIDRGAAYESGGDVFFSVRSFGDYGKLSGRRVDDLLAGARVATDERKRDPLDFVLWKAAKPKEPSWPSPWGEGRPGWHIECSAMSGKYLGAGFDIHAGGVDLVFPHHENEIAQWEAATGSPFARCWVHNGHLTLGTEKMSKSVGNIISLAEALDRYGADTLRMFFLRTDYRAPAEFSEERLAEAATAVERLTAFLRASAGVTGSPPGTDEEPAEVAAAREEFVAAMDDDLSTPRALAAIFDLVSVGNRALESADADLAAAAHAGVRELSGVLGFSLEREEGSDAELVDGLVAELVALRAQARSQKDFATGDRIRARLAELGIAREDTTEGTRWHRLRRDPVAEPVGGPR
jgi:cysteinyl-tRNA synthetase